jgi:hypothetical protein
VTTYNLCFRGLAASCVEKRQSVARPTTSSIPLTPTGSEDCTSNSYLLQPHTYFVGGNCNVCRNIETISTHDVTKPRNPKSYRLTELFTAELEIYIFSLYMEENRLTVSSNKFILKMESPPILYIHITFKPTLQCETDGYRQVTEPLLWKHFSHRSS